MRLLQAGEGLAGLPAEVVQARQGEVDLRARRAGRGQAGGARPHAAKGRVEARVEAGADEVLRHTRVALAEIRAGLVGRPRARQGPEGPGKEKGKRK